MVTEPPLLLVISPHGRPLVESCGDITITRHEAVAERRIAAAFAESGAHGLLHLASAALEAHLRPDFAFARELARVYLTHLCRIPQPEPGAELPALPPPAAELAALADSAPPMRGSEYLTAEVLAGWWGELDALARHELQAAGANLQSWLESLHPLWRTVGRVTFHLAENKRDEAYPFAFLATYVSRLSAQGRAQHLPLARALEEHAGAGNRSRLLSLLQPIQQAAEASAWVRELVDSGGVYHPLAWTPREAYRFLQEIPAMEAGGLIVRVPDWWKATRPPRPVVNVRVGEAAGSALSARALLDFDVRVAVEGEPLSAGELQALLDSGGGLVSLKGRWVEVDRDKLAEALRHWKGVEREAAEGGLSFFEGMRLLSGLALPGEATAEASLAVREWSGVVAGKALEQSLKELQAARSTAAVPPPGLQAELRAYQQTGLHWLLLLTRLGLGACLADDMGLGKTIQVIALLLQLRREKAAASLLVVPASLLGNWKAELERFAPTLRYRIAHPSESNGGSDSGADGACDLVITTYTMLARRDDLRGREWHLAILDEAQAIKNSGARQTKAVKQLRAGARIVLTGTPIENRLSDLWSLFDFLNPGLLGNARAFSGFVKKMSSQDGGGYAPLRALVRPYILRRLKTDRSVIADLPEKTEMDAFCSLSKHQAALYDGVVQELERSLTEVGGMQRRGLVLATLMRLKQICNHPAQLNPNDGGGYAPEESGKFQRLAEICEELAERQEKVLIFTQFRQLVEPLAEYLMSVFNRGGLMLDGSTPIRKRQERVAAFQREDGPPFFVISLKAGGTGLNLTAASHVIHFDRWWNPAVENQATDRAFRIGQKRNVMVHKFVCRGTVEEKISALLAQKSRLSDELLKGGGELLLTEMDNAELLRLVRLDLRQALES